MSDIKSKKAKQHIKEHILDKRFNDGQEHPCVRAETAVLAIYYAEQEAEQRHQQQLQELRDRAVEAFMEVCPLGHPERPKNVGLQTNAVCPYVDIIGFSCCNDKCPFLLSMTQKLTEKQ